MEKCIVESCDGYCPDFENKCAYYSDSIDFCPHYKAEVRYIELKNNKDTVIQGLKRKIERLSDELSDCKNDRDAFRSLAYQWKHGCDVLEEKLHKTV